MFKSLTVISLLFLGAVLSAPNYDESSAKKFITESSDEYSKLYSSLAEIVFEIADVADIVDSQPSSLGVVNVKDSKESDSTSELDSDEISGFFLIFYALASLGRLSEATENITTITNEVDKFPVELFKDEEVKIGIWKLKTIPGLIALGDKYDIWLEDDLDDLIKKENLCKYKDGKKKCDSKYAELRETLFKSNDPEEILYYWKEWRERNLPEIKKRFPELLELFKKLVEHYKKSPKFTWYKTYLDENFGDAMEKVVEDMQPLFKELHAYIRHILHETYGDKVPADGLIPHHLYEWAWAQAWKHDTAIAKEFTGVKMPIENNFGDSEKTLVDTASDFMKSMGLSELPKEFWDERVKLDPSKDDCEAEVYEAGKNTYLTYCKGVSIRKFLQMHGYMARVHYSNEHKDLPFAYSVNPYDIDLATGEAVILSAGTPKYLHAIGHKDVDVLRPVEDMNRLYRMGVHTILSIPEYFIHSKVMADVLDGKVAWTEMNKHYWDLMKQYVGVAPPVERSPESFDFPYKFYRHIEDNAQTTKFATEVMGYQIYEALCKEAGEFVEGDPTHSLHTCSLYKNTKAGKLLQNMMQLGSKKPWKEVLGTVTGNTNGMKAEALLHYYAPLKTWLETKNKEHGVKVGW